MLPGDINDVFVDPFSLNDGRNEAAYHGVGERLRSMFMYAVAGRKHFISHASLKALDANTFVIVPAMIEKANKKGTVSQHVQIRLPQGADCATLRAILHPHLPCGANVYEERPNAGRIVLKDSDKVKGPLVLPSFAWPPLRFYTRFSKSENAVAFKLLKQFFIADASQQKLDEFERQARAEGGDSDKVDKRYQALLCNFLAQEVYPEILRGFSIPDNLGSLHIFMHATNWVHLDMETTQLWLDAECLMGNWSKVMEAQCFIVFFYLKLNLPLPEWCSASAPTSRLPPAVMMTQVEIPSINSGSAAGHTTEVIPLCIPHTAWWSLCCNFLSRGWVEIRQVGVPEETLRGVHSDACYLESKMHSGRPLHELGSSTLRTDRILWLREDILAECSALRKLIGILTTLVPMLAQRFQIDIQGQESPMLAEYGANGFFRRHIDGHAQAATAQRVLTAVYYLNKSWSASKGGELRIHHGDGSFTDIMPREDTLVLFLSRSVEHEVRVSQNTRRAVTIWFHGECLEEAYSLQHKFAQKPGLVLPTGL